MSGPSRKRGSNVKTPRSVSGGSHSVPNALAGLKEILDQLFLDAPATGLVGNAQDPETVLRDFDVLGFKSSVIVPHSAPDDLRRNIAAAAAAHALGLKSVDGTRRRYIDDLPEQPPRHPGTAVYVRAFDAANAHVRSTFGKLLTANRPPPRMGVFGASLVLGRLEGSLFAAHLLYRLGHPFEAHTVSRLVLEQAAWAVEAAQYDDLDKIAAVRPQSSMGRLKRLVPLAGRLYGELSSFAHLDYSKHRQFTTSRNGRVYWVRNHGLESLREGLVLLDLADIVAVAFEATQAEYIEDFDSCVISEDGDIALNVSRSFPVLADSIKAEFASALGRAP